MHNCCLVASNENKNTKNKVFRTYKRMFRPKQRRKKFQNVGYNKFLIDSKASFPDQLKQELNFLLNNYRTPVSNCYLYFTHAAVV